LNFLEKKGQDASGF
jgi:hypothetical protein